MSTVLDVRFRLLTRPAGATIWVGRIPFLLSILLGVDVAGAAGLSLLYRELLRGPDVTIGSLQGTAVVLLVVALPVLAGSILAAMRGFGMAIVSWLGVLTFVAYQGVLFLFATPFNPFFFFYLGMLSLSAWSIVAVLADVDLDRLARAAGRFAPVRVVAGYLLVVAGFFAVQWLRALVPAVLSTEPPAFLEGTGMTTGPGQILDLGFFVPAMVVAAYLLVRRRPAGYLLTGPILVGLAIETVSIAADQWMGHAADPTSPVASADIVPLFIVATIAGLVVLGLYLRPAPAGIRRPAG